ncbi:MAG TPA: hypothetical protein VKA27_11360 [Sunxiuqinia sp.]|nr:hypothetical protein [Sunxiuqinia sp.]
MTNFTNLTKKMFVTVMLLVTVVAVAPLKTLAQENHPTFAVVDFMKVNQGDEDKYVQVEENYWKPIHQERIKDGEIVAWELYKVRYTGTDDEYNFVTVTLFDDPAKLEHPLQVDWEKIKPEADLDKMFAETMASRQLVKKILFMQLDGVDAGENGQPVKYLQVNFMKVKPGGESAYVANEQKVWKPVHQEFVKNGTRAGWSIWQTLYPNGAGEPYQYVTVDDYNSFAQLGQADFQAAFKKAHGDEDVSELLKETDQARTLEKSELWELLDIVVKPKE